MWKMRHRWRLARDEVRHRRGIGAAPRDAVASLGVRPTVHADGRPVLEVHLFDFTGDLYGAHADVSFIAFLREERRFDGLEALKSQIGLDTEAARRHLARLGAVRGPFEGVPQ